MSRRPSLSGVAALFPSKSPEKQPSSQVDIVTSTQARKSTSKHVDKRTRKHTAKKPSPHVDMSVKEESPGLVRYTMYFTPELLEKLEDVWMTLRREHHSKVPRWKIANLILEEGLHDQTLVERLIKRTQSK